MKLKQTKGKKVALGVLTATMAVSPLASFAQHAEAQEKRGEAQEKRGDAQEKRGEVKEKSGKSQIKHSVPLLNNQDGVVAPNAVLQLTVDKEDSKYKSVREELENQSFGVLIVSENGENVFLSADKGEVSYKEDGTISVHKHADFERYSAYSVSVLVKSDFQHALKSKLPTVSFGEGIPFQTGSAVGEATNVVAELVDASVSVEEKAILKVEVTDDYANPATDATLIVSGVGTGNDKVDSTFTEPITVAITNGTAEVELSDQSANDVTVNYQVIENKYADNLTETGITIVEFTPGQTDSIELDIPQTIEAGEDYTITGEAEDLYGNSVEDGTAFDVESEVGTVSNENATLDGEFSFDYEAPTKVGTGDITIVGDDFEYVADNGIVVIPTAPANVLVTIPSTVNTGENVPVSGTVQDKYANPIPNVPVKIDGALSGTVTTDENGQFTGTLTPGTSGSVTATVGGQTVSISTPTGTPVTSVTVVSSTPTKVTMTKPSTVVSGKYYAVSGTLLDQKGQPIANKTISFAGSMSGTITTNAYGQYSGSLRANSTGSITAKVGTTVVGITTPTGSTITSVYVSPPAPVVGTTPKNVTIKAFGFSSITISGKITDASGNPVPNAKITLQKSYYGDYWSSGTLQSGYTDSNGNYSFSVRGSGITVFVKTENNAKSDIIPLIWGEWT